MSIFKNTVFSGSTLGVGALGSINLDTTRAMAISQGKTQPQIDSLMFWAAKVKAAEDVLEGQGMSAAAASEKVRMSTTDATYAHYVMALNPALDWSVLWNAQQKAAIAYENTHPVIASADTSRAIAPTPAVVRTAVPVGAPAPVATPVLIGGLLAAVAIGGVVAWKMGVFGKKAAS